MTHPAPGTEEPAGKPNIPVVPGVEAVDIERLKQYPFLANLSETVLRKLQPGFTEERYKAGATILRAGGYTDAAYYLTSGFVSVLLTPIEQGTATATPPAAARTGTAFADRVQDIFRRDPVRQAVQQAAEYRPEQTVMLASLPVDVRAGDEVVLEAGEVFGEMSALSRYPISADVVARTDVECLLIRTAALRLMFKQKGLADFKAMIDTRYRERTLSSHLRSVGLFADLDETAIEKLRRSADLVSYEPGALIVEQGKPADAFYLVRGGYVRVALQVGASNAAVSYLRRGDYAGEIGLLLDEPWPFTLSALEHVQMVKLTRDTFQEVLAAYPAMQQQLWDATVTRLKERGSVAREPLSSRYLQMAMDTGLIHGESVLLIDLNTCTRCDDCVRGCADTHGGVPRFIREGSKFRSWSVPTACYQCTDPVCMIGCPTGAITRPLGTLEVTINTDTCIGCGNCVKRCPWGNIIEVPFHSPTLARDIDLATKCDLCLGRAAGPACVQMCPHGSAVRISFKDLATVTRTLSD